SPSAQALNETRHGDRRRQAGSRRASRHAECDTRASGPAVMREQNMRYAVVIERGEMGFGAYVPDLPGCIAAAETREEVVRLIQDAIEFHIEGLKENGE